MPAFRSSGGTTTRDAASRVRLGQRERKLDQRSYERVGDRGQGAAKLTCKWRSWHAKDGGRYDQGSGHTSKQEDDKIEKIEDRSEDEGEVKE